MNQDRAAPKSGVLFSRVTSSICISSSLNAANKSIYKSNCAQVCRLRYMIWLWCEGDTDMYEHMFDRITRLYDNKRSRVTMTAVVIVVVWASINSIQFNSIQSSHFYFLLPSLLTNYYFDNVSRRAQRTRFR